MRAPYRGPVRSALASPAAQARTGAMLVLIGMMLIIFLVMIVFAVDVSYMQLTRSELRVASDAAAKAGTEALRRTQDPTKAVAAAIEYASYNQIGGKPLKLNYGDIELGQTVLMSDGSWDFVPNAKPPRAVRINASLAKGSASGPVNLFFAGIFGHSTFSPKVTSVAAQFDQDVVLCLDRSHSMCFDLSGVDWVYPAGTSLLYPLSITLPPHPTASRWAALTSAVDKYVKIIMKLNVPPRVGVITWASDIDKSSYEYTLTKLTSLAVVRDLELSTTIGSVLGPIMGRALKPMLGATNMSAGLSEAVKMLDADKTRPLARKTIILMTDGLWNQGADPLTVAATAKAKGIVIHTVTFLPGADQKTMIAIATLTGGKHYYAVNAAQLEAAFSDLAYSMPVLLTE